MFRRVTILVLLALSTALSGCKWMSALTGTWDGYNNSANRYDSGPTVTYPVSADASRALN